MNSVLYIEDEEDYQILVQRILGKAGFAVRVASSAVEGRALLRLEVPDLLILDVNLPDTDGYELCSQLKDAGQLEQLPVLFLTVKRRPEEWLKGFSCGGDDYLSKPLNPPELVERVQACLSGRQAGMRKRVTIDQVTKKPEFLLIKAALAGNRSAFEVLVQKYHCRLLDSLRAAGRNTIDAEDIASTAFARAFERLSQFRGQASFYTWLYRIALNESYRPRWRCGVSLEDVTHGPETTWLTRFVEADNLGTTLAQCALQTQVQQAVSYMPKPYRQMLRWHFVRGLSCRTLARRLKIPPGTVMSRLFKAKQLLRESWRRVNR